MLRYIWHKALIRQSVEEIDQSVEFFLAKFWVPDMPMNQEVFVLGYRMSSPTVIKSDCFSERVKITLVHIGCGPSDIA